MYLQGCPTDDIKGEIDRFLMQLKYGTPISVLARQFFETIDEDTHLFEYLWQQDI